MKYRASLLCVLGFAFLAGCGWSLSPGDAEEPDAAKTDAAIFAAAIDDMEAKPAPPVERLTVAEIEKNLPMPRLEDPKYRELLDVRAAKRALLEAERAAAEQAVMHARRNKSNTQELEDAWRDAEISVLEAGAGGVTIPDDAIPDHDERGSYLEVIPTPSPLREYLVIELQGSPMIFIPLDKANPPRVYKTWLAAQQAPAPHSMELLQNRRVAAPACAHKWMVAPSGKRRCGICGMYLKSATDPGPPPP